MFWLLRSLPCWLSRYGLRDRKQSFIWNNFEQFFAVFYPCQSCYELVSESIAQKGVQKWIQNRVRVRKTESKLIKMSMWFFINQKVKSLIFAQKWCSDKSRPDNRRMCQKWNGSQQQTNEITRFATRTVTFRLGGIPFSFETFCFRCSSLRICFKIPATSFVFASDLLSFFCEAAMIEMMLA